MIVTRYFEANAIASRAKPLKPNRYDPELASSHEIASRRSFTGPWRAQTADAARARQELHLRPETARAFNPPPPCNDVQL